jgi:hypothetical protein
MTKLFEFILSIILYPIWILWRNHERKVFIENCNEYMITEYPDG